MIKRLSPVRPALIIFFGLALSGNAAVPVVRSWYNLTGFGNATTGGGVIATNDPAYVQVTTPLGFANALQSAYKTNGSVKVIEIMNDLSLGWIEIGTNVQAVGPFRLKKAPLMHPVLQATGVSVIDIKPRGGLTIFSANGATIKHCDFNIKDCTNIIIRNLRFDETWEWDEKTKGKYDENDWDFMTIGDGGAVSNLWIDHCTFTKSYDGLADQKAGVSHVTFSWNKYVGDDGATNPNSWVWQQINSLETTVNNSSTNQMYYFLRHNGFSTTDIVQIIQAHDKTHLAGQSDLDPDNASLSMTFHHQLVNGVWDRCMPRLRAGNAHDYNIYVDDTSVLVAKRLRDTVADAMSPSSWTNLNNTYSFNPPVNGSISTENGAVLVEKSVYIDCLWPLRNNQVSGAPAAYTGKIMALDSIYHFDTITNTVDYFRGDSTNAPNNCFGPAQYLPALAFSWNLPGNQLPYTYTMHDPSQLHDIVTSPTAGAGAGVLTWDKTNWLATAYPDTAPIIDTDPQSQTVTNGQSVTLDVTAYGSLPLSYQWYFDTNSVVSGGTNMTLTITSVQPSDLGTYSVVVSNSVGIATSAYATLSLPGPLTPFQEWQTLFFHCTGCPEANAAADPDGDGQNNMAEFLSGTDPTNSVSALRITSAVLQGNDVVITWMTAGEHTNAVQATAGDASGGYTTNNFLDITTEPHTIISGSGDATTNYVDEGGGTNTPSRFYRIRLVP